VRHGPIGSGRDPLAKIEVVGIHCQAEGDACETSTAVERLGRVLGDLRAPAPEAEKKPPGRKASPLRLKGTGGNPVRLAHRHSVVPSAARARLRIGRHLLAEAGGVAESRCLGRVAPGPARAAPPGQPDRAAEGSRRFLPRAGEKGSSETGSSPVDRGRLGSKHHLIVDQTGLPLAARVTAANRNDVTQLLPLIRYLLHTLAHM
jgi:hypothetical protein